MARSQRQRQWGWHELDSRWAQRLVAEAGIEKGALVLDVGAGSGALTGPLLASGARVIAVEAHPDRARALRNRFGEQVVVVEADAADLRLPRRPYAVVANPPFSVTTPLMRRLLQSGSRLVSARLVLQEQAARRWASPAAPGRQRWANFYDVSVEERVPRSAFHPWPRVDARILTIRRRVGR